MIKINENFLKLQSNYLFSEVKQKVAKYQASHPKQKIISLGIGDVTQPLPKAVVEAMKEACKEMENGSSFKGYGPEQGYSFLREKIAEEDYQKRGIEIEEDEIFISDGAKCDCANISDIFSQNNKVAITDPVYPVYLDSNVMAGRSGDYIEKTSKYENIVYLPCDSQNGFVPNLPETPVDMIYLCYPNNPTGTVLTQNELKLWIDYAKEHKSIILFDSAYESYITSPEIPHSIYEIEGAKDVAIEFRSFSKTAGFTGIRCAYVVIPKELKGYTSKQEEILIHDLWSRRSSSKFNGVSYITQKGAEAVYSKEGKEQIKKNIDYYLENVKIIKKGLEEAGYIVYGGENSPYLWLQVPNGKSSWQFFDELLEKANIVGTPRKRFWTKWRGIF